MQATPRIVMPIRSPLDVAYSLKKRNGFSLTKGLLLWLRHVLDAEVQSRSEARSIFTWEDFVSDWRQVCGKISTDTGLSWPRLSDRASYEIDHFLTKDLVHHETDHARLRTHSEVHEWTLQAYEALLELARNPFSNSAMDTLDRIRTLVEQSSKMFGRLLMDYEVELENLQARPHALTSDQNEIRAESTALAAERDGLYADRERIATELQAERQKLEESAALAADLLARAEQAESAHGKALRDKGDLSQQLAATTAERDGLYADRERIAAELQAERQKLKVSAATAADLLARVKQVEKAYGGALREKEDLSQQLAATVAERERIATELQAERQKLEESAARAAEIEHEHAKSQAALDAAQAERDKLLIELGAANREREAIVAAHQSSAARLEQVFNDRQELAANLDRMSAETRRIEQAASERLSGLTATHAQTLAAAKQGYDAQIQAMHLQLVDAEAAVSNLKTKSGGKSTPGALLRRRFQAWMLLRSGLFDAAWYRAEYPDIAAKGVVDAMKHYLDEGFCQGLKPNPFFDTRWYLDRYEDVRRSGMNPLLHYLRHGYKEGRDPGPAFQTDFYLEANPDVRLTGVNPLAHYLRHGRHEGRLPKAPVS